MPFPLSYFIRCFIFLDVDGVLNSARSNFAYGPSYARKMRLDGTAVKLIEQLCQMTQAGVVISSSMRGIIGPTEAWEALFAEYGAQIPVVGLTPHTADAFRGDEVRKYLEDAVPFDMPHVIFDDDSDFHPGQPLIKVNRTDGLSLRNVVTALGILAPESEHFASWSQYPFQEDTPCNNSQQVCA